MILDLLLPKNRMADTVIWSIIGLLTIIINIWVLVAIYYRKNFLNQSIYLIMASLCCSNILFTVLYIFPRLVNPHYKKSWLYCSLTSVFATIMIVAINLHLMAISIDRFLTIYYARHYFRNPLTLYRTKWSITIIWLTSVTFSIIPILTYRPFKPNQCLPWDPHKLDQEAIYYIITLSVFFILPNIIMISCNIYIVRKIRILRRQIQAQVFVTSDTRHHGKSHKLALTFVSLICLYLVMWIPLYALFATILLSPSILSSNPTNCQLVWINTSQYLAFSYPLVHTVAFAYTSIEIKWRQFIICFI